MKIIPNYPNVVIGSRTVTEYKFQILNFMNLLRNVIENDNDFSSFSYSNLDPWCHNLQFEIRRVEKEEGIKIWHYNMDKIYSKINAIQVNLRTNLSEGTKHLCLKIWDDLLKELTKVFDLKYTLEK